MVDLNNIGGAFKGVFAKFSVGGFISSIFWGVMILLVLGLVGFFVYRWWKNMTFFTTPVSLTILMDNGMEKTRHDLKGGSFWNRGIRDFKIKVPKQRKAHILGYMPDFGKSPTTDGRLHFITSGDRTVWQQYESQWVLKETGEKNGQAFEYDLVKKPVPREVKELTINSIRSWRETIDKQKLTAFSIAIGAFIIMAIAHLISLFIQTRIKCGVT